MMKTIRGIRCKSVETEYDVYFDMALTMLEEIIAHNEKGEKTVMIVPVGPTQQYPILAEMVNRLNVSLKNVHFFRFFWAFHYIFFSFAQNKSFPQRLICAS